jgi:hypothetical protein
MTLPDNTPRNTPEPDRPGLDKKIPALSGKWGVLSPRIGGPLIGGAVWALVCYLLIPNWVLSPINSRGHSHSGMPIWSLGILVSAGSAYGLLLSLTMRHETALSRLIDRNPWLNLVVILGIIVGWIVVFEKK